MNLTTYIQQTRGNGKNLAQALGIPTTYLSQMAGGERSISPERCVAIERATGGEVSRKDLRPDDWHLIWPELGTKEPSTEATHA